MHKYILALGFILLNLASPAGAVVIDVTTIDLDTQHYLISLTDIDQVEDRVYTIRTDADGAGEVIFGDGVSGARPPTSDSTVVATYRHGSGGTDGKIVNVYPLIEEQYPLLIPMSDFIAEDQQQDVSFVLIGMASIKLEFSTEGLLVVDSQVSTAPVPGTAWLLGSGLLGLFGTGRRKSGKSGSG